MTIIAVRPTSGSEQTSDQLKQSFAASGPMCFNMKLNSFCSTTITMIKLTAHYSFFHMVDSIREKIPTKTTWYRAHAAVNI